jgi:hypothetical protein
MIAKGSARNYRSFGGAERAKPQASLDTRFDIEARLRFRVFGYREIIAGIQLGKLPKLCRLVKSFCPAAVDWIAKRVRILRFPSRLHC